MIVSLPIKNQQNRLRRRLRRISDASASVVGVDHTNSELSSSDTMLTRKGMWTFRGKGRWPARVPTEKRWPKSEGAAARAPAATELMVPFQKPTCSVMAWLTMMMITGKRSAPVVPLSAFKLSKPVT